MCCDANYVPRCPGVRPARGLCTPLLISQAVAACAVCTAMLPPVDFSKVLLAGDGPADLLEAAQEALGQL